MPATVFYDATTVIERSDGTQAWTNPNDAVTDDDSIAINEVVDVTQTINTLIVHTFGQDIDGDVPADASIIGIEVQSNIFGSQTFEPSSPTVSIVTIDGATQNIVGSSKIQQIGDPSTSIETYGGRTDLWGATEAEMRTALASGNDFGVSFTLTGVSSTATNRIRIDWVKFRVHFLNPPSIRLSGSKLTGAKLIV